MSARFEQLDWRDTPLGVISLRRRRDPVLGRDVLEVKLGDEFLMSSAFTVAEIALADLGLAATSGHALAVLVGGLGLGYTAQAVLADDRVRALTVVEALGEVIEWHEQALVPVGAELTADPRCRLVHDDFFDLVARGSSEQYDAVLVDIDHSPRHVLSPTHADFYTPAGLRRLAGLVRASGVFALWSDDPPDDAFLGTLASVFREPAAHVVRFANPYTGGESTNTVYVAVAAS